MNRKGWLLAVVLGALLVRPVVAGPACPHGEGAETLDWYLVEGRSCSIGDFTVKGFTYSNTGVTMPESAITVYPSAGPQGPSLRFSSATDFYVGPGDRAVLELVYNIDPPPIIIRGFEEDLEAYTPNFPGFVTIDTWLCVGGAFPGRCGAQEVVDPVLLPLHLAHYGADNPDNILTDSIMFEPTSILGVWHTITLDSGGTGDASFTSLGNQAYTVPEPGTWLLLGCGLLSLAVLRRRRAG